MRNSRYLYIKSNENNYASDAVKKLCQDDNTIVFMEGLIEKDLEYNIYPLESDYLSLLVKLYNAYFLLNGENELKKPLAEKAKKYLTDKLDSDFDLKYSTLEELSSLIESNIGIDVSKFNSQDEFNQLRNKLWINKVISTLKDANNFTDVYIICGDNHITEEFVSNLNKSLGQIYENINMKYVYIGSLTRDTMLNIDSITKKSTLNENFLVMYLNDYTLNEKNHLLGI